jgi:hypothetical protein
MSLSQVPEIFTASLPFHIPCDIKPEEMLVALTKMNNGKSQGLEGFTTEFYNCFWSDLKYFGVRFDVTHQSCTLTNETSFHETHQGIRDKIC